MRFFRPFRRGGGRGPIPFVPEEGGLKPLKPCFSGPSGGRARTGPPRVVRPFPREVRQPSAVLGDGRPLRTAPEQSCGSALTCAEWAARPGWIPDPLPRVKVPRPDFLLERELLDGSPGRWSGICRAGFEPALSRLPRSRKSRTGPAERTGIRPESLRRTAAALDPPAQVRLPFQYSAFPARNHGKKVATSLRRLLFSVLRVLFSASFPCFWSAPLAF